MLVSFDVSDEGFNTLSRRAGIPEKDFARTPEEFYLVDHLVVGGGCFDRVFACGGEGLGCLSLGVFEVEDELLDLLGLREQRFGFDNHEWRKIVWGKFSCPYEFTCIERRHEAGGKGCVVRSHVVKLKV